MRYRIIREYDDNGTRGYYCDVWRKGWFGSKWKPITELIDDFNHGCVHTCPKRFNSIQEVEEYIRSLNVNREIVKEIEYE